MAGGRWEFGTGQLANFAAGIMSKEHTAVNPFKPAPGPTPAQSEAARIAESRAGWKALREEALPELAAAWRRKHGHRTADGAKAGGAPNGTGRG